MQNTPDFDVIRLFRAEDDAMEPVAPAGRGARALGGESLLKVLCSGFLSRAR